MSMLNEEKSIVNDDTLDKTRKKRQKLWPKWVRNVVLLTIAGSFILVGILSFAVTYLIRTDQVTLSDVTETDDYIERLYNNNLILYLDLVNRQNTDDMNYWELYEPQLWEPILQFHQSVAEAEYSLDSFYYTIESLESNFSSINQTFDYYAKDLNTGDYITNGGNSEGLVPDNYLFYVTFLYDENGNVSLGEEVKGADPANIRKIASNVLRRGYALIDPNDYFISNSFYPDYQVEMAISSKPQIYQCAITYGLAETSWMTIHEELNNNSGYQYVALRSVQRIFILLSLGMLVFAFLTRKKLHLEKYPRLNLLLNPFVEILLFLAIIVYNEMIQIGYYIIGTNNGLRISLPVFIQCYADTVFCAVVMLLGSWYIGTCAANIKEMKVLPYLRQKSALVKLFHWMVSKVRKIYQSFQHIDLTQNSRNTILKLIWANAFILLVISVLWFGGIVLIVIYSFIVYFILKKYAGDVQKKYGILLEAINEIAQGNLRVTIKEDIGIFEPFKPQIERIQQGFRSAVEEEMKSQRMKTELITNVSHDLKTPLTAIITYIDLLKIDEERRMKVVNRSIHDGLPMISQLSNQKQKSDTKAVMSDNDNQASTMRLVEESREVLGEESGKVQADGRGSGLSEESENVRTEESERVRTEESERNIAGNSPKTLSNDASMILSDEKRLEYLITLEKKALRLKVLIEDLFEVSKAASKNVTLNIVDVDIYNLVKQVALEMSDKFKQANLDLRLNFPEEKLILPLDSQKTYRIYENLFGNIAKYALTGTRVYVNAIKTPGGISITLKNITEQEIAVTPEELTDRFVRGDAARNTEGSGLGLSIAKSFMELQGGKLVIEIDGDLFKAITSWEIL